MLETFLHFNKLSSLVKTAFIQYYNKCIVILKVFFRTFGIF